MKDGDNNADGADKDQDNTGDSTAQKPWEALGFSSFAEYDAAGKAAVDKEKKANTDAQAMITRQSDEIGTLRKEAKETGGSTADSDASDESEKEKSEKASKLKAAAIYSKLSPEEVKKAETAIGALPDDIKGVVTSSFEGKLAFLEQLFPSHENVETAPDGVFSGLRKPVEKKSISEQIAEALKADGTIVHPQRGGSGLPASRETELDKPEKRNNILTHGLYK